MAGRWKNDLNWSDVTPKAAWLNRRQIIAGMGAGAGALALGAVPGPAAAALGAVPSPYSTDVPPHSCMNKRLEIFIDEQQCCPSPNVVQEIAPGSLSS